MTILDEIIEVKKEEVENLQSRTFKAYQGKTIEPFKTKIDNLTHMGIIAEIKRASPSKGMINEHVDPVQQAKLYEANGVQAISRSEEHTSELQSRGHLVCRLLLAKKNWVMTSSERQ